MLHYTECGLDNIWLMNGYEEVDTPYGKATIVDNERGLHEAIVESLYKKSSDLTGHEFLFLRKEMDMSQMAIAEVFGVQDTTIRNFERKEKLGSAYSHLMKAVCQEYFSGQTRINVIIEAAKAKHDLGEKEELHFTESAEGWKQAA